MTTRFLALIFLAFTVAAEGREKIPLMPPPEAPVPLEEPDEAQVRQASLDRAHHRERSPSYSRVYGESQPKPSSVLLGFELGTQGRQNTTSSDALGLKLLWGGRVSLIFPIASHLYLKPSVGFFYRRERTASVAINEHMAEGGLQMQYALSRSGGTSWMVGVANRLEVNFSRTTISALQAAGTGASTSETSAPAFRYRIGPSIGFTQRVTNQIGLLLDLEATFSISAPVKPYGGLAGGLIFHL